MSSSVSNGNISGNSCTPETVNITLILHIFQVFYMCHEGCHKAQITCHFCPFQSLKLADLDYSEKDSTSL